KEFGIAEERNFITSRQEPLLERHFAIVAEALRKALPGFLVEKLQRGLPAWHTAIDQEFGADWNEAAALAIVDSAVAGYFDLPPGRCVGPTGSSCRYIHGVAPGRHTGYLQLVLLRSVGERVHLD